MFQCWIFLVDVIQLLPFYLFAQFGSKEIKSY